MSAFILEGADVWVCDLRKCSTPVAFAEFIQRIGPTLAHYPRYCSSLSWPERGVKTKLSALYLARNIKLLKIRSRHPARRFQAY